MAFALQYDGVNDYCSLPNSIDIPSSTPFELEFSFAYDGSDYGRSFGSNLNPTDFTSRCLHFHTSQTIRLTDSLGNNAAFTAPTYVREDYNIYRFVRDSSNSIEGFLNGTSMGVVTNYTGGFSVKELGKQSDNIANVTTAGGTGYFSVIVDSIPLIYLDPDSSDRTNTSAPPVITDTVGDNNATGVNMPTDGSSWVDLGGGSLLMSVDNTSQPQTIDNVTLTQHSIISINSTAQAQTVDQVSLSEAGTLSLNNLEHIQTIEQINLTQAHIVSVNDTDQAQTVDQVSLSEAGTLSLNKVSNTQALEQAVLSVIASLIIDSLSSVQTLDQLVATAFNGSAVSIDSATQNQTIDQLDLSQFNVVSVDNLSQDQLLESINFNGVVVGHLQGALTIFSAYNGIIKLTNPLTGEIRIL